MEFELNRDFNIDLNTIEETKDYMPSIKQAIEIMQREYNKKNVEVVINKNLIVFNDKFKNIQGIFGVKVSFDNLDKDVSFIVRENIPKPNYEELYFELKNKLDNIMPKD